MNNPSTCSSLESKADQEQEKNRRKEEELSQEERRGGEERARCEWDFNLSTVVSSSGVGSDALSAIEFDPSDRLLATGGIARKIRVYSTNSLLPCEGDDNVTAVLDHSGACDFCMCTPAKLSSLKWKPNSGGRVIGSGDYDGSVMEYDLEQRTSVFERDEHGGHRVWSVDYSHWNPVLGASGSDDGTLQLWDSRCDGGRFVATVRPDGPQSSVCCVKFNPFGGALVVAGSTGRNAYAYDIRKMVNPVLVYEGHLKPVTYVEFLNFHEIVTSGIDGCLKLWDVESARILRTYRGHENARNFVGLSVWRNGGLLSCGSESNEVFVYDKRWGEPIWGRGLELPGQPKPEHGFVSGVCWRQVGENECTFVAGGSNGILQVFAGRRKAHIAG